MTLPYCPRRLAAAMATEQRLLRLEEGCGRLITKSDLTAFESRLLRWLILAILGGAGMAAAVTLLVG